jgi:hypothetical protein
MLLYKSDSLTFTKHIVENTLTGVLENSFRNSFGFSPNPSEVTAWRNSLPKVKDILELAELRDVNIALEYEVPYNTGRIDCLLFGKDTNSVDNIVLIELKQWSSVVALEDEGNFVETYTGRGTRVVAHPAQQIKGYEGHLKNFVTEFENEPPLVLFSCAYCHNYKRVNDEGLFAPTYKQLVKDFPVYTENDTRLLANKIKSLLSKGDGFEVFNRFMQSPIAPSKKLLESISGVIDNKPIFSLLNEQLVAKNIIWSKIRKTAVGTKKSVVIVHGGPGTGKSVIALNILAEAARRKKKVFYACKSKPFVSGLIKMVGPNGGALISNLNRFIPAKFEENDADVLLIDEAHRIGKTANNQFTPKEYRTDVPQIDLLIRAAKTSVFFLDDMQNIRSLEVGSAELIRETAKKFDCSIDEVTLETQFRCMGSNNYLQWLESTLEYSEEKKILSESEKFEFKIFNSPKLLYSALLKKEEEGKLNNPTKGNFARIVAGFCWPWSQQLDDRGDLVKDVVIGDFAMPWETHDSVRPPKGYAKWYEWAYKPEGIKQVGCIYTAQGFEFDYVGVIVGDDLVFNPVNNKLECNINATADPMLRRNAVNFDKYVKNIYRVLMSRGMKGCYVYFTNKETEKYFRSRIETRKEVVSPIKKESIIFSPYQEEVTLVPLYGSVACGTPFEVEGNIENMIPVPNSKLKRGEKYFIVRAKGDSMNKADINDGDLVLCRHQRDAEDGNKIVALTSSGITIKELRHEGNVIVLYPKSTNSDNKPILLTDEVEVQGVVVETVKI